MNFQLLAISNTILFILFFMGVLVIGIVVEIFRTKCPSCGKLFGRKIQRVTRSNDSNMFHMNQDHTHVNSTSNCKCKFCGHEWQQHYKSTKRK